MSRHSQLPATPERLISCQIKGSVVFKERDLGGNWPSIAPSDSMESRTAIARWTIAKRSK
jgi:hypothetical protein